MNRCLGILLLVTFTARIGAFTNPVDPSLSNFSLKRHRRQAAKSWRHRQSALEMGGIFDDIQNFFSGDNGEDEDESMDAYAYGSENRIATIPVREIKPGGLRLFLMFYLMGMQNTPDRNAWKADQPTRDEYVLDFYFHDRTAMLTVELAEELITIDRIGAVPSNAYLMQESVIVQGILDELQQIAFDESIDEENRLLQLSDPKDAIEQARAALSFG